MDINADAAINMNRSREKRDEFKVPYITRGNLVLTMPVLRDIFETFERST